VEDKQRTQYYRDYINEMLKAINIDGVNVTGYTAWSLMDNYEWRRGYTQRFGVHYVNFSDPNLTRVPKSSAIELKKIFNDNGFIDPSPNPSSAFRTTPWKGMYAVGMGSVFYSFLRYFAITGGNNAFLFVIYFK